MRVSKYRFYGVNFLFMAACCLSFAVYGFQETIDRIAAVVNEEVITLTDLKIAEDFGLYEVEEAAQGENLRFLILDKLIDQKLVIQLTGEKISVGKDEIDEALEKTMDQIGRDEVQRKLIQYGLEWDDLRDRLQEKILYQKIIYQKFSQAVTVSLREIESYYNQVYVPSQKEKEFESRPIVELLDEIELTLKQQKMNSQIAEWIKNLRKEANIEIKMKSSLPLSVGNKQEIFGMMSLP